MSVLAKMSGPSAGFVRIVSHKKRFKAWTNYIESTAERKNFIINAIESEVSYQTRTPITFLDETRGIQTQSWQSFSNRKRQNNALTFLNHANKLLLEEITMSVV